MPVAKTTVKQQVYNLIFSDVLEGNFPLDEFITEKQLMERYQAGKAPVREALIELCSENILHSRPRLGYQIIQVTEKNIADATELRLNLELGALKRVQTNFTEGMLNRISTLNQNWWQDVLAGEMDLKSRWRHNSLFHATLASFGGNELAVDVVRKMIQLEWRAYAQMLSQPEQRDSYFQQSTDKPHLTIERALAQGDFEQAQEVLRQDIMTLPTWILKTQKRF